MALRNKFAAHNDSSGLDEAVIDVQELNGEFVISQRYAFANPLNEYAGFMDAVSVLESYIVDETSKALDSLEKRLQKKVRIRNAG